MLLSGQNDKYAVFLKIGLLFRKVDEFKHSLIESPAQLPNVISGCLFVRAGQCVVLSKGVWIAHKELVQECSKKFMKIKLKKLKQYKKIDDSITESICMVSK